MEYLPKLHVGDVVRYMQHDVNATDHRIPLNKLFVVWEPDFLALKQYEDACEVLRGTTRFVYATVLVWPRNILGSDRDGPLLYRRDTLFHDANGRKIPHLFLRTSLELVERVHPGQ